MTRIAIVADTLGHARQIADLLADNERVDIVDVRSWNAGFADVTADVVVAVGLPPARASQFGQPVVLISDRPEFGLNIRAAFPAGASAPEIIAGIEAAANDLVILTHEQATRWISFNRNTTEEDAPVEELTGRELQVLRMIADGNGNKEIALALAISEHTVKFHVAQILAKLNAGSRAEAVSLGLRRGLIPI